MDAARLKLLVEWGHGINPRAKHVEFRPRLREQMRLSTAMGVPQKWMVYEEKILEDG